MASIGASVLASQALVSAAVVAASDKNKSTNVKGNEYPLFYYTIMDGGLYPDVIMMLQAIDLKSERLNPVHDLHDEQHRTEMSNFTSVMFLRLQHFDVIVTKTLGN